MKEQDQKKDKLLQVNRKKGNVAELEQNISRNKNISSRKCKNSKIRTNGISKMLVTQL